jgi:hypothetical protein
MSRQPRDRRRSGVRVALSDRDRALLAALGRFRIARTSDLVRYGFPSTRRDTALRRLRRLFDAGYLAVASEDRSAENLYSLARSGRVSVASEGGTVGRVPRCGLTHHLAIVSTWVELALLAESRSGVRLDLFRPDWEIREKAGRAGSDIVPDGLFQLRLTLPDGRNGVIRAALEVDLGTERQSVLVRKLSAYAALSGSPDGLFGWHDVVLALFAPGAPTHRIQRLERLLGDSSLRQWWLWRRAEDIGRSLDRLIEPPLTTSPYREGSRSSLSGGVL